MTFKSDAQRRIDALTEIRVALDVQYDIQPEALNYNEEARAVVIEYRGNSSDGSELLQENLYEILIGCGYGLRHEGWPDDFEQVVGIAVDPVNVGMSEAQAIRWNAPVGWIKEAANDHIESAVLQKKVMETARWVFNDGTTEDVDVNVDIVDD